LGQPLAKLVMRLLAGEDLIPSDRLGSSVALLDGGVEDPAGSLPNVAADAVSLDEGDDRTGGNLEAAVLDADRFAVGGRGELVVRGHRFSWEGGRGPKEARLYQFGLSERQR